jgi:prophage tail gpP-like protein
VLWPINKLVRITAPLAGVDGDMLITETVFNFDADGGTTTQLTLKRPDAFLPQPQVQRTGLWKEIAGGV